MNKCLKLNTSYGVFDFFCLQLTLVLLVLRYLHGSLCLFDKNGDEICAKISFSYCV